MLVEERVFRRARFVPGKAEACGFRKTEKGYEAVIPFMDGDFDAEIVFDRDGRASGRVIDRMTGDEYDQIRNPRYTGAYVGSVREEYERLLNGIAEKCCERADFESLQANRITDRIMEEFGVAPDFPWDSGRYEPAGVFRHVKSRKWFALVMGIKRELLEPGAGDEPVDVMNLKADAEKTAELHRIPGIFPAYHMNHRMWISVTLDDIIEDDKVMDLVRRSYELTGAAPGRMNEELIMKVLGIADSVPFGRVATYGQIARLAGMEKNSRLVGKIMSLADRYGEHPCHRVVNASGRTVPGWDEQRPLLEAEGITFKNNGCVDMPKHLWKA